MNNYKLQNKFDSLKCCIIVPTYNNSSTLNHVLDETLKYTRNIIVINDGSTDSTANILSEYSFIKTISHKKNRGKGVSLRTGFSVANKLGYDYAITIDSDGQHKPDDLPKFIQEIEKNPGSLILGARNMDQKSVPGKSSFGHKFSNFWCLVETGLKLPDTQTGFRLYPINKLKNMRFYTKKFEFEIEVLVRAAWKSINITHVPIDVYYAPKEKRVSHFRPFRDFARVSLLNTFLVVLALTYFRPLLLFKEIKKKGFGELLGKNESNHKISSAIGFGVLMGIVPIWGYQTVAALFLAHLLKLNKLLVFWACNISIPPMIPLIIFLSFKTGELFVSNPIILSFNTELSLQTITIALKQYIVGASVFAVIAALAFFIISYLILSFRKQKR